MNHLALNLNTERTYQEFHHHDDGISSQAKRRPRVMQAAAAFCHSTAAPSIHATLIRTPRAAIDTPPLILESIKTSRRLLSLPLPQLIKGSRGWIHAEGRLFGFPLFVCGLPTP